MPVKELDLSPVKVALSPVTPGTQTAALDGQIFAFWFIFVVVALKKGR